MDKFTEKIGLFDLWGVLFPGLIGSFALAFNCNLLFHCEMYWCFIAHTLRFPNDVSGWIVFCLSAAFSGMILQEIGRLLRKICKLPNAAEGLLDPQKKSFQKRKSKNSSQFFRNIVTTWPKRLRRIVDDYFMP